MKIYFNLKYGKLKDKERSRNKHKQMDKKPLKSTKNERTTLDRRNTQQK